ncbi:MAG: sugar phosphate isomerase/epimerase [Natronospirillum sp.]|uniref:sugar phosphate isomerase/epimerase family protein n=1 Tax=Natronospirillum sp. TaxID=2812955 RepID=UPI0025DAE0F1|nr:sugar phosphate isomerase/epimerase [Natronospirillum sp.]MCH8550810.1 sugar phosphate isomerase/epimerase [Natronospirillum sp.]
MQTLADRLAFFTPALDTQDWPALLQQAATWQLSALELGVGGYPGTAHADALALRNDPQRRQTLRADLAAHGVHHLVLSCHSNPLHPDVPTARQADDLLQATLELANAWEVDTIVTFSGVGGSGSQFNWPIVGWPSEYPRYREAVWQNELIPYWQGINERAREQGVRVALEMHGGFLVHSPGTLLELRRACGPWIGANLDPSHFWWQGLDPLAGIEVLAEAVFHVHLKDWRANPQELALWGFLDPRPMSHTPRAWQFAVPGSGHGDGFWRAFLLRLQAHHYTGLLSLEHEDPDLPPLDGIQQGIDFMRQCMR